MARTTKRATGNISPSRFVKLVTAADSVGQSGTNEAIYGISQEFPRAAPVEGASAYAAAAGEELMVYTAGDDEGCLLEIGSGGITLGVMLTSDTDGKGIALASTAATLFNVGAIALETGSAGDFVRVKPLILKVTNPA